MKETIDWVTVQKEFLDGLLQGDKEAAIKLAKNTLDTGCEPLEFFEKCVAPSLEEVGKRFETLDIFLPEMVTAAEVVELVNKEVINPAVAKAKSTAITSKGKILLATVHGDLHDIGKNMVALMLKVNGFEVIDMGVNISPSDIVDRAAREQVDIIGLSTLLTTCLPYMKDVSDYLQGKHIRENYPVIIGGAATTPEFAKQVGADAQGNSAAEAVEICKKIMQTM